MNAGYRPQLLWLIAGPLLGAGCGAAVGTVLVWGAGLLGSTSAGLGELAAWLVMGLVVGSIFGAVPGLVVGLVVGVPMAFLVGRHLPPDVALRRAYVLGALLPPATLTVLAALVGAATWALVLPLAGAALLGSTTAAWLVSKDDYAWPVF